MLTNTLWRTLRQGSTVLNQHFRRNFGITAVIAQKAANLDPIQKLFLDNVQAYAKKSKTAGGGLVDATPETTQEMQDELERIAKTYGADVADFSKFPTFNFNDVELDQLGVSMEVAAPQPQLAEAAAAEDDFPIYDYEPKK